MPGQLYLYLDLHAHATKRGAFIYGNHFDETKDQAQSMLYPKLISMNTFNFDYNQCNFTEKLMKRKDKKGVSREGAGRVAVYRDCPGLIHSYTLECNYCSGLVINKVDERFDIQKQKFLSDNEPVLNLNSDLYNPLRSEDS